MSIRIVSALIDEVHGLEESVLITGVGKINATKTLESILLGYKKILRLMLHQRIGVLKILVNFGARFGIFQG